MLRWLRLLQNQSWKSMRNRAKAREGTEVRSCSFTMCRVCTSECGLFLLFHIAVTGSLVPGPSLLPLFGHLQYANTVGEGLGDLVACGASIADTWRAVHNEASRYPFLHCPSKGWMPECSQEYFSLFTTPLMDRHETGTVGHHPPCVYLLST